MRALLLSALLICSCTKETPKPEPTAASATASVAASAAASDTASDTASATASAAATATATDSVAASATAPASVAGKGVPPTSTGKTELPGAVGSTSKGTNYDVVVPTPKTCEKGADCSMIVRVTAGPGFHVNKEYPTKLTLDTNPNMEGLGTDAKGKNIFSVAAGNFLIDGEQVGTMNAKMKPSASGLQTVGGTLSFSVCSQSNCQRETAKVTATIPVR